MLCSVYHVTPLRSSQMSLCYSSLFGEQNTKISALSTIYVKEFEKEMFFLHNI